MLDDRQQGNHIEGLIRRHIVGETARNEPDQTGRAAVRQGGIDPQAIISHLSLQSFEKFPVGAADIEHSGSARDIWPRFGNSPILQYSVKKLHDRSCSVASSGSFGGCRPLVFNPNTLMKKLENMICMPATKSVTAGSRRLILSA